MSSHIADVLDKDVSCVDRALSTTAARLSISVLALESAEVATEAYQY